MKEWIDISMPLSNSIAVWPGDTPFCYELDCTKEESGSVNIGKITMSTHTGTHIDAPFHFDNEGKKVLDLDINVYIGLARVIDVSNYKEIGATELKQFNLDGISRLLLKTNAHGIVEEFPKSIPSLGSDVGPFLQEKGIILIGVDVPSVDALDSKELAAHHSLGKSGVHILENIMLQQIEPGDYELIALPLPLKDGDGSPVRAVLKQV